MQVATQVAMKVAEPATTPEPSPWSEQTRGVLTRDLLVRASQVPHGESRALHFRVLHLNLALVSELADRLGLAGPMPPALEHAALEGLLDAVRRYDPHGEAEFPAFAAPFVRERMLAELTDVPVDVSVNAPAAPAVRR